MLESIMSRSGEHEIHTAKLLEVASTLELLRIYYVPAIITQVMTLGIY